MISRTDLESEKENINKWLSEDTHFADVYSMHTNDEGWASSYFGELKQRYPDSNLQKIITLWKFHQIIMAKEGDYHICKQKLDVSDLIREFRYVEENFNPREYAKKDHSRIEDIFTNIEPIIQKKPGNFESRLKRDAGVYRNGILGETDKLNEIRLLLSRTSNGVVVDDEWNEFTVYFPVNSNMYMFHWSTGA